MEEKKIIKAGFCQFNVEFGKRDKNLKKIEQMLENEYADIFVLPELFSTGYLFTSEEEAAELSEGRDGESIKFLKKLAKEKDCFIFGGFAENDKFEIFNSSALIGHDGTEIYYRKTHLFQEEKIYFQKSDNTLKSHTITTKNGLEVKVGLMICFDWIFPEMMRTLCLDGAELILHTANLVLPYCPEAMVTRCVENRVYSITCNRIGSENRGGKELNYIGRSRIVAPKGEVLAEGPETAEQVKIVELDLSLSNNKNIGHLNHLFADRRTDLYKLD